ncbi:hypothetical protein CARUB_v10015477mg [Capsella rubella]|uniref:Uncharacterized protein n=2 Tax=Capsella rubella TaxID=81985 RepID=R0I6Z5_9BRAS|nr:hypothetical protein CARUB_v10015477mg [Capsella rubella]
MIQKKSYCFLGITTIYFFYGFLGIITFASLTQSSLCRHDQRDALLELQKEFGIPTTSWNTSVDCCSWLGVTCDDILGEVRSLYLRASNVTVNTSLKTHSGLFKLQHLRELDLSFCHLQGDIPYSIGNLSHLTSLRLSLNNLVGEVPASIGNLNQLRYMDLSCNHIRGNIPTSFANLTKLSILSLYENKFTGGDIEVVLANLTGLTDIDLSTNHFKSSFPSFLLKMSSLVKIDLVENQFEGTLDFGNTSSSSKLEVLSVGNNNFYGLVPESISKLQNLNSLDLSKNNFKGKLPSSISKLDLNFIDLSYNKFEGQVPHNFWRVQLRPSQVDSGSVKLSHNSFNSFGKPVEVTDGATLAELDLGSNSFQETFPQWICKFRHLTHLDLSNNHFSGSIPQCLKNFTGLQVLNLGRNSLSGFIPDFIASPFPDFIGAPLRSLDVSHNNLIGKLPKSLINCFDMEFLNVKGNKIKDTFPFWLESLQLLNVLMLGSNAFHGPIYNPSAYLGFPNLQIIDISNNNFVGSLPQDYFANWTIMSLVWDESDIPEFGYMVYSETIDLVYKGVDKEFDRIYLGLKAIDFSGNRFSGHIPGSIGLLSELRLLNLSGNAFTGNIPPSMTNITKLEILDLSRNNLSGEIPRGLGKLSFLSYINVSHNHLQGLVPQSSQFGSQNCSSFMDNPGLYGFEDICRENNVPLSTTQQLEESLSEPEEPVLNWIAAAIAFGPAVFCGLVIGHIFTSYKHMWFIAS